MSIDRNSIFWGDFGGIYSTSNRKQRPGGHEGRQFPRCILGKNGTCLNQLVLLTYGMRSVSIM